MTPYCAEYYKMTKQFHLERSGFICTLPKIHPADFVLKYNAYKDIIYVADNLIDLGYYISCYGAVKLSPNSARQQLAKLMYQYKEILVKRKLKTIEKEFK